MTAPDHAADHAGQETSDLDGGDAPRGARHPGIGRFRVGDTVLVERDETRWPSRGSWPQFRGRTGTVRTVSRGEGEVGVAFTRSGSEPTHWFRPHELTVVERVQAGSRPAPGASSAADDPREPAVGHEPQEAP